MVYFHILGKKPEDRKTMEDGNDSDSASTTASSVDTTLSDEADRVDGQGELFYSVPRHLVEIWVEFLLPIDMV